MIAMTAVTRSGLTLGEAIGLHATSLPFPRFCPLVWTIEVRSQEGEGTTFTVKLPGLLMVDDDFETKKPGFLEKPGFWANGYDIIY